MQLHNFIHFRFTCNIEIGKFDSEIFIFSYVLQFLNLCIRILYVDFHVCFAIAWLLMFNIYIKESAFFL